MYEVRNIYVYVRMYGSVGMKLFTQNIEIYIFNVNNEVLSFKITYSNSRISRYFLIFFFIIVFILNLTRCLLVLQRNSFHTYSFLRSVYAYRLTIYILYILFNQLINR